MRRSPPLTEPPLLIWLPLLMLQIVAEAGRSIDWDRVKPVHMVPMFAPHPLNANANASRAHYIEEPQMFDLESEAMQEEMFIDGGASSVMAMNRIFGGSIAEKRSFPYQVGLLLQRPKGLYWCGGSLISDEYVLTAAHCVDMAKKALVFLGAYEIKNAKETGQMRLKVTQQNFIIYPRWNPRRLKDDIAIVRLPETIEFTDKIQPIQLPRSTYVYRQFPNKLAIASGWGRYATGVHAISNVLRYVHLQIAEDWVCKRSFPMVYRATNICTSGRRAKSTCNGDSGGPLALQCRDSKRRVLVGITSFGSIHGCNRGYPAAYTKVASYLDWITDQTGVDPFYVENLNGALMNKYLHDYRKLFRSRDRHKYLSDYDDADDDVEDDADAGDADGDADDDDDDDEMTPNVEPIYQHLRDLAEMEFRAARARKTIRKF